MGKSRRTQVKKSSTVATSVQLKQGIILCDATKRQWQLGKSIGAGGFGQIYLVSDGKRGKVPADAPYVAKIELLTNGPLFVEKNFYVRVAKEEFIAEWKKRHNLKHLGMPMYHGFGSYQSKSERYRFLILDRFGPDIGSIFLKNDRRLNLKTVYNLGLQIVDILEYLHFYGYIHADIKGSNLLLGLGEHGSNKVYLLDYGLACLYVDSYGRHKEYNQDLRRAHDGTLEYTSRDAHVGAHSRRGDIEVLGYNLVQWISGRLPWESDLFDPDRVAEAKNMYMGNIPFFLDQCFPKRDAPAAIQQFLKYVAKLSFTAKPDYNKLRSILRQGLKAAHLPDDGKLDISSTPTKLPKHARSRGRSSDTENRRSVRRTKTGQRRGQSARNPCGTVQTCDRRTRQQTTTGRSIILRSQRFDWVKVLQSHPERDAKPAAQNRSKPRRARRQKIEDIADCLKKTPEDPRTNPTPAMSEVLRRLESASSPTIESSRRRSRPMTPAFEMRRKRLSSTSRRCSRVETSPPPDSSQYTPAMEEVLRRRALNSSSEPTCSPVRTKQITVNHETLDVPHKEDGAVSSRTRTSTKRKTLISLSAFKPIQSRRFTRSRQPTNCYVNKPSPVHPTPSKSQVSPLATPDVITSDNTRLTRLQARASSRPPSPSPSWSSSSEEEERESSPEFTPRRCVSTVPWSSRRTTCLLASPRKRRYSVVEDYTSSSSSRLSKKRSRLPTEPKYRQRNLSDLVLQVRWQEIPEVAVPS